jgi:hypothetical protein
VPLARLIRHPTTDVVALDRVDAASVGRLLAASGPSDIADAHVVICARRKGERVVTSDPADLRLFARPFGSFVTRAHHADTRAGPRAEAGPFVLAETKGA